MGTFSNINPYKVYDYHTTFDIKPTQVVYNVDINANNKKILNINLDRNSNNSAATVGMVKELFPHTINNLYRKYFEEVFDFSDATNYGLNRSSSGVVFNALVSITGNPTRNIGIPNRTIDDIKKEGLNVSGYNISFSPAIGNSKYTLCIVFYHRRNRRFYIFKKDSNSQTSLVGLSYSNVSNEVRLIVIKVLRTFTLPSSFNGKKIVIWLAEDFSQNITKVKISNYSAILSLPIVRYTNEQEFTFETKDGVLNKLMYSPNFYDTDSEQYHKVMLQEKLNGSYIV